MRKRLLAAPLMSVLILGVLAVAMFATPAGVSWG